MLDENGLLVNLAHSGHCRACKERVHELLTAIYGDCQMNQVILLVVPTGGLCKYADW
jgi:hypothetical protein